MRVFNFSAGPAVLPESVLQQAAAEMLDWHGSGMSVMEMSHRGKEFISIADKVEADLRALLAIPANYKVLFLQGGAIAENAIVPMNLLRGRTVADYVHTGEWSKKSIKEAGKYCTVNVAASAEDQQFTYVPARDTWKLTRDAAYVHVCTNETIGGVEYQWTPDVGDVPLVADMSSHILSRPMDVAEVRSDLRRRAEKHGSGGPDIGDRARRSAGSCLARHTFGVPLAGAGGERFDAEHAADVRDVYRRPRVRVAARARRACRHRAQEHRQGEAALRLPRRDRLLRASRAQGGPVAHERRVPAVRTKRWTRRSSRVQKPGAWCN